MLEQITQPSNLLILSGFILILLELFIGIQTGFDLVLVGSSLIISGMVGNLFGNHLLAFFVASVLNFLYVAFGRKIIKQKIIVTTNKTNIDQLIGKVGIVTKEISPSQSGSVKINDEDWRAASPESIAVGEKAEVVSIEGVTLQVKKI